ncbi:hypothetical protein [Nocardioides soli]|uniref:Uncharacterized protein n=1 Tax=Nocardioides soli TaxID=1036020 RepID=A0A7W4VSC0_9ACTN|nr:hypothetical protein [Nocardioides soli]MBB3040838.1 hypothetical protein [Nocardioides soli]
MSKHIYFIAPDGRAVQARSASSWFTNRCDATLIVQPATLNGKYPDRAQGRELHVTFAGGYDPIAFQLLDAHVEQQLTVPGGEFIVYRSSRSDLQGLALWRGPYHEIASWLPPVAESEGIDPWGRFSGLRIEDAPDGVLVTSAAESAVNVRVTDVSNYVEGVGMLYFYAPAEALGRVPTFKGRSVPSGEVWRTTVTDLDDGPVQTHFVLASPQSVVSLVPEHGAAPKYGRQLAFLESLLHVESNALARKAS